jgi:hypothetical protein
MVEHVTEAINQCAGVVLGAMQVLLSSKKNK